MSVQLDGVGTVIVGKITEVQVTFGNLKYIKTRSRLTNTGVNNYFVYVTDEQYSFFWDKVGRKAIIFATNYDTLDGPFFELIHYILIGEGSVISDFH